jgi:thioesterase domain-containing protein
MTFIEILEELKQKGIKIDYSGGKLKYSGPKENITPDIIEILKQNKGKLIKYLWPKELGNLMPINPEGSQIPLFIVHGDNGNYIISDFFGPDQPVFGFFHPGSEGEGICYKSVEEFAAGYLRKILSICPEGPYYLIGYSFGGLLAYEMAVQLQKMGRKVPFLVIIDTFSPLAKEPRVWQGSLYKTIRINYLRPVRRGLKHRLHFLRNNSYVLRKIPIPPERRTEYLWYKYLTLGKKYSPLKFNGNILLFRLTGNLSSYKYLGWETLVNEVRLVEIDGRHLDVFIGKDRNEVLSTEIGKYLTHVKNSD